MKKSFIFIISLLFIFSSFALANSGDSVLFKDLDDSHWAYNTIKEMVDNRIINGYPDGTFRPENNITRAEATKILMLSLKESMVFPYRIEAAPDVPATHWASGYIINGDLFVKPYEDGSFKPDQKITRLEFANALGIALESVFNNEPTDITFTDLENLDERSLKNIATLVNLGIINGYEDGTFKPDDTLTRAELSKMVANSLQYRTTKYEAEIEKTTGWYEYDKETGWHAPIPHDDDGNLKVMSNMNGLPIQIYYNGKFIKESDITVLTTKLETIKTDDDQEWNIKWFGNGVVYIAKNEDDGTYTLFDYATDKEYPSIKSFSSLDEAEQILKFFFDFGGFKFFEEDDQLFYGSENSYQNVEYELDISRDKVIPADAIENLVWMIEVNLNTIEQKEFHNNNI